MNNIECDQLDASNLKLYDIGNTSLALLAHTNMASSTGYTLGVNQNGNTILNVKVCKRTNISFNLKNDCLLSYFSSRYNLNLWWLFIRNLWNYQTFWIGFSTVLFCSQYNAEIQRLISIPASSVECNRLHHQKRPIWLALIAQWD